MVQEKISQRKEANITELTPENIKSLDEINATGITSKWENPENHQVSLKCPCGGHHVPDSCGLLVLKDQEETQAIEYKKQFN